MNPGSTSAACIACGSLVQAPFPDAPPPASGSDSIPDMRHHKLLNSNEPPLEVERPFFASVVSHLRSRLSHHDAKLARLRAQYIQLQEERATLSADLRKNTAVLSSLRRMPPEILSEIFVWTLPSELMVTNRAAVDLQDSPWMLTHICGHWRRVAIGSPSLWSFLVINGVSGDSPETALPGAYPLPLIRTQLQRANRLRLFFMAPTVSPFTEHLTALLELLAYHSLLWEEVLMLAPRDFLPIVDRVQGRLPLLRRLWIQCNEVADAPQTQDAMDCFQVAPALRDVTLVFEGPPVSCLLPANQLTRYHILCSREQHFSILNAAKNLTEARIHIHHGPVSASDIHGVIELGALRRLWVSDADVLGSLKLPALHDLAIMHDILHLNVQSHIDALVTRSSCTLRRLCVDGLPAVDLVTGILQTHQEIVELAVLLTEPDSSVSGDALVMTLARRNPDGIFEVAPRLSGLFFGCSNDNFLDDDAFYTMLASRTNHGALKSAALVDDADPEDPPDHSFCDLLHDLRINGLTFLRREGTAAVPVMFAWTLNTCLQWLE
ncbi:hypothetical protein C8R47DRAFT_1023260 [Mycena vitilis]|nr:hypothetical protein C8R47DRAFT_1023260 [Mycena vitilis]